MQNTVAANPVKDHSRCAAVFQSSWSNAESPVDLHTTVRILAMAVVKPAVEPAMSLVKSAAVVVEVAVAIVVSLDLIVVSAMRFSRTSTVSGFCC